MRQNMKRVMQGLLALVFTFVLAAGLQVGAANAQNAQLVEGSIINCRSIPVVRLPEGKKFRCILPKEKITFEIQNESQSNELTVIAKWGPNSKYEDKIVRPSNDSTGEPFPVNGDGSVMSMYNASDQPATADITVE